MEMLLLGAAVGVVMGIAYGLIQSLCRLPRERNLRRPPRGSNLPDTRPALTPKWQELTPEWKQFYRDLYRRTYDEERARIAELVETISRKK